MSQTRDHILNFLNEKGVEHPQEMEGSAILLEYISSMDFMELIVHMETVTSKPLDMANADIESIVTLDGFLEWVKQGLH